MSRWTVSPLWCWVEEGTLSIMHTHEGGHTWASGRLAGTQTDAAIVLVGGGLA